jgi:hypothetical protein
VSHEDAGEGKLHIFLSLTHDKGEWSASCSYYFTPKERDPIPNGQEVG